MMREAGEGSSVSSIRCQDCGNQAKKGCVFLRCRTCCKTRGFQCQTHVKSTWIPVSGRRQTHHYQPQKQQQLLLGPNPKRYRESPPLGFDEGNFPAEVTMPAIFKCVRVSSVDNAMDQYAYQTSVNIGGHVFKGILYDQGQDNQNASADESSSGGGGGLQQQQQPNLITTGGGGATSVAALSPPSYPPPFSAFMSGMPFLHYPKS